MWHRGCSIARRVSASRAHTTASLAQLGALGGERCADPAAATFCAWHGAIDEAMRGGDPAPLLRPHMHEECIFRPPTYYTPWVGADETLLLLTCVSEVFGTTFTYGRQWLSPDGFDWALEFKADIAETGRSINGVDLIRLDEFGRIVELTVLARPPNGVDALKREMMKRAPPRLAALKMRKLFSS
mmetsp:Transcript_1342/g.2656  ORF Transcript_1342/g.2656 Transcript_1342/m.2656 type:complete len:185 (-) Transcript_1342:49-603(-)|eukprot:CAMPEP_0119065124 /NCGR_PEP_ID=MMETSP1178-20130426/8020_1 /TAXON_ID=33656 /ORGANISM="unid sp, Strain CCMP2000" /LENGTH=184 /DNA_ID=CAMNT_0007046615 /DNA_START=60 /DNA_END=614 /DNA_ORIENTATION=-